MPNRTSARKTAALCWLGWVFDFYDLILIAFLMPLIEHSLHIPIQQSAWLLGIGLGASGLGGIIFGWLADIYGRKRILCFTILMFSLGMLLSAFVQNGDQLFLTRLITGLGLGGEWAVGHALVSESVPAETRGRWSAFLQSGEPVGVAIAAIVGFMIAPHVGWRTVFLVSSMTGILALVFRRHIDESPLWLSSSKPILRERIFDLKPFIKRYWGLMLIALVLATLKLGTYWTCYTWLPRFIKQSSGISLGESTLWFLCGQLGQFIGMGIFGVVADSIGRRWSFTLFSVLTALAIFPLAAYWQSLISNQITIFWVLMFLLGIGSGCTAGFGALLAELFPTEQRTFAMGTVYNTARGIQVFAPVLVGLAVQQGGLFSGLFIPVILALGTASWVWLLPERKGVPLT